MHDFIKNRLDADGQVIARPGVDVGAIGLKSIYHVECRDKHGNLKWTEEIQNTVVNTGLNDVLNKYFLGSSYTAGWFVGLKGSGSVAAGDTMSNTGSWTELTTYSGTARASAEFASAASQSMDNSANRAAFSINASASVAGAFLVTDSSAGGSAGVLYGAADFSAIRVVENGDTLNVTVTLTAASA